MIPEINISITDPPRERWRLSQPNAQRARELILRTVDEVGGVAPYRDYLLEYAATCVVVRRFKTNHLWALQNRPFEIGLLV